MSYKLAIFDLDGTVLDTIADLAHAMNGARKMSGLPEQPQEKVQAMVGNGIRKLIERSTADEPDADGEKLYRDFMAYYCEHCTENTYPYPGITEMLTKLRAQGIRIALNTNKPHVPAKLLCDVRLPGLFDSICGHKEGIPLKPDPYQVNKIMEELGAAPEDTVYVGDSEVDILTAKNAGIDAISVDWGLKTREFLIEHNAPVIVSSAEELEKLISG